MIRMFDYIFLGLLGIGILCFLYIRSSSYHCYRNKHNIQHDAKKNTSLPMIHTTSVLHNTRHTDQHKNIVQRRR
jgi:hypothetical protein